LWNLLYRIVPELARSAAQTLSDLGFRNVTVRVETVSRLAGEAP
jgi:hypothetical protein